MHAVCGIVGDRDIYGNNTAVWHRVLCIDDKIHENLLQLSNIGFDEKRTCYIAFKSYILAYCPLEQFLEIPHHAAQVDRLQFESLFAPERKKLAGEFPGALRRTFYLEKRFPPRIIRESLAYKKFRISQ